jgi:hypothetical protein
MHTDVDGLLRVLVDTAANPPRHVPETPLGAEAAGSVVELLAMDTSRFTLLCWIDGSSALTTLDG